MAREYARRAAGSGTIRGNARTEIASDPFLSSNQD